ncbi:FAD synthase [Mycoplasma phocoenae]|uniref:FAD synthase n=1 Tax=Mycoplasma phocoenae TaxID=754517 RepID=A0A858U7I7_9MOLU|nr:riboflavin biosynthesis protein [Mycoplasma phocoenae]QJG67183.1 riboflavin biosynthesis protein [Mycoplasma phocoenae]
MTIFKWPLINQISKAKTILVLGSFETLHLGHYELFKKAKELRSNNPELVIVSLLFKDKSMNNIIKVQQLKPRIYTLDKLGVEITIIIEFNEEFKNISANKFIEELKKINVEKIVCGSDYRFGFNRTGTVDELKKHFDTHSVKLKKIANLKISSSVLKELIKEGKISAVNQFLIDKYSFITSISNYKFTFPVNIQTIPNGIYLTNFVFKNIEYHGFIHINGTEHNQVIIFDLNYDILYFDEVLIEIISEIRHINHIAENKIFESDNKKSIEMFKKSL